MGAELHVSIASKRDRRLMSVLLILTCTFLMSVLVLFARFDA